MNEQQSPPHRCTLCGGSCQGVFVSLLPDEEPKVRAQAEVLSVREPIVDGRLRREQGRCVFLDEGHLCRIHQAFGGDEKPAVCQQYPLVAVRTSSGLRVGIDPGCYTHIQTRGTGEPVDVAGLVQNEVPMDKQDEAFEQALVHALSAGRLGPVLDMLGGQRPRPDSVPSKAFQQRWAQRLREAKLHEFTQLDDFAPAMRQGLDPLIAAAANQADEPAAWSLPEPLERHAADAVSRLLHLRVANSAIPVIPAVAILGIGGAVATAWSTSDPDEYGWRLAAWVRAIRIPAFWRRIIPDTQALMQLARG